MSQREGTPSWNLDGARCRARFYSRAPGAGRARGRGDPAAHLGGGRHGCHV